jgi:hypothetical protein
MHDITEKYKNLISKFSEEELSKLSDEDIKDLYQKENNLIIKDIEEDASEYVASPHPGYVEATKEELITKLNKEIDEEKQKAKENLAQKMKANWAMCRKMSPILGQPQEAVFKNLELVRKYYKQIKPGVQIPHFINLVLIEGNWPYPIVLKEKPAQEALEKRTYDYKTDSYKNDKEPKRFLDITFWYIKEMGSLEKAEKMLAAAKVVIEALK